MAVAVKCDSEKYPVMGPAFYTCDYLVSFSLPLAIEFSRFQGSWHRAYFSSEMFHLPDCANVTDPTTTVCQKR